MTKGKTHLDGTKRCRIESGLREGESGKAIARAIYMHVSSVTREIRKHACESFKGCYGRANQCVRRQECRLTQVCGDCTARGARCAVCSFRNCNRFCGRVEYIDCPKRLLRTAQVCNGYAPWRVRKKVKTKSQNFSSAAKSTAAEPESDQ